MLELRPNCEICDRDLPPTAREALICTNECTFCTHCDETLLHNVCPNCGGELVRRPLRPTGEHRPGEGLTHNPPSTARKHTKYSTEEIVAFVATLRDIDPAER